MFRLIIPTCIVHLGVWDQIAVYRTKLRYSFLRNFFFNCWQFYDYQAS